MAIANTTIQIKKSTVSGNTPSTLANGEIAINTADGKLFYRTPSGSIGTISQAYSFATVNANSSLILATSSTDTLSIVPGNNIVVTANTTAKSITVSLANNVTLTGNITTGSGTGGNITGANNIFANTVNVSTSLVFPDGTIQYTSSNNKTQTYFQNTAPSSPNQNDLWLHRDTGVMYENFGNTTSPVWAEVGPTNVTANTIPGSLIASTANVSQINVSYAPATTMGAAIQVTAANTVGGTGYADVLKFTNTSGGATQANKTIRLTSIGELQVVNSAYLITSMSLSDAGDMTLAGNTTINGISPNYAPNRPAFRVYGANTSSALSTTQNGTGQLNYNNWALDYNQGGYLNYTGGTFTVPVSGLYQISLNCRNAGNASFSQLICYKNSSNVMIMIEFAGSSTMNHTGGSTIAKLAAGDTLIIKVGAGTVNFDANDNWSVAYLG